jgi:hypothetical protein
MEDRKEADRKAYEEMKAGMKARADAKKAREQGTTPGKLERNRQGRLLIQNAKSVETIKREKEEAEEAKRRAEEARRKKKEEADEAGRRYKEYFKKEEEKILPLATKAYDTKLARGTGMKATGEQRTPAFVASSLAGFESKVETKLSHQTEIWRNKDRDELLVELERMAKRIEEMDERHRKIVAEKKEREAKTHQNWSGIAQAFAPSQPITNPYGWGKGNYLSYYK